MWSSTVARFFARRAKNEQQIQWKVPGVYMIVTLAGGVGAARFLEGIVQVVPPEDVTAIVNTGDDITMHGLYISPDLDIVTYTLAGIIEETNGWGIRGDTTNTLEMLK